VTEAPKRVARVADDYYPTPRSAITPILSHLPSMRTVCDPACGIGEIFDVLGPRVRCFGIELDEARAARGAELGGETQQRTVARGNALRMPWPKTDGYIYNPPFADAEAFVRKGLAEKHPRATIAVLLRLTFQEPTDPDPKRQLLGRAELHRSHPPDVYILPERPRFSVNRHGKPGTDSVTAAWFVYGPGRGGRVFWL
jgi:hypothetical protein